MAPPAEVGERSLLLMALGQEFRAPAQALAQVSCEGVPLLPCAYAFVGEKGCNLTSYFMKYEYALTNSLSIKMFYQVCYLISYTILTQTNIIVNTFLNKKIDKKKPHGG